jgi:hypothetical protein
MNLFIEENEPILYEVDGEKTIDGLLEDLDCKAEMILFGGADEEDAYELANLVQEFYAKVKFEQEFYAKVKENE